MSREDRGPPVSNGSSAGKGRWVGGDVNLEEKQGERVQEGNANQGENRNPINRYSVYAGEE